MSYRDLPPTWPSHPLTDPAVAADVVDLFVTPGDRRQGTLAVLLCDAADHYQATVTIHLPDTFRAPGRGRLLSDLAESCSSSDGARGQCGVALAPVIPALQTAPGNSLVLALGRPGGSPDPELDNEWSSAAVHLCRAAGVRLLGFYVATADGVYQPVMSVPMAA